MSETDAPKYLDPSAPLSERVDDLVGRMTLEEKVAQTLHAAPAIPRLKVPEYNWWNECLHGVGRAGKATVFPQAIGMAASWNEPLMHRVATAISDEARAKYHEALRHENRRWYFGLTFWTPNINIFRDPRWGRGHETYGEDPYLTGRMGIAFVKGLQGDDEKHLKLVATPKHYAVHSGKESERHHFDAVVNQRDLRETYLRAFKMCVQEGKALSIMGAYNRTNGEACCASKTLLQDILRDEWGFDGYVVSDCGAIRDLHENHKLTSNPAESAALALKNGCELNCGSIYTALLSAVDTGLIDEATIDVAVKRLFTARFRLGMFDPDETVSYASISPEVVNCSKHRELAREMARQSIVLLKNNNDTLPLSKDLPSVAVLGPTAFDLRVLLGNYYGYSPRVVTPLEGITAAVSAQTRVSYDPCVSLAGDKGCQQQHVNWAVNDAEVVIAVCGWSPSLEGEEGEVADSDGGGDRVQIGLPGKQLEFLQMIKKTGRKLVVVLTGGSPIACPWVKENADAVLMLWYPGEEGGNALADVLFGDVNPGGRLPLTFPESLEQLPEFTDYAMPGRTYRFMGDEPLWRFGYGLSYTAFEYSGLKLSASEINAGESLTVTVTVKNTGKRDGDEVVQLYMSDDNASVPVPKLHLEGFRRLFLKTGESKDVSFVLNRDAFVCYDDDGREMVEPGQFRISVGGGQPEDATPSVSETVTVK